MPPTASSASFTRCAVTVGKASASALMSEASSAGVPPRESQCCDVGVGRAAERAGREYQDEIDAEALPVDRAQIGDCRRDVAAEHVNNDGIAKFQMEPSAVLFSSETNGGSDSRPPPLAFDDARACRNVGRIGDAAVACSTQRVPASGFKSSP